MFVTTFSVFLDIILAGIPPTMQLSGILSSTTAFAAITTLLPTFILPKTFAPAKITTLSPISGTPKVFLLKLLPMVTP